MDTVNISKLIEVWLANNAQRAKSMSMHIQIIADAYLEISIDGHVLKIAIPHDFYTGIDAKFDNLNCGW